MYIYTSIRGIILSSPFVAHDNSSINHTERVMDKTLGSGVTGIWVDPSFMSHLVLANLLNLYLTFLLYIKGLVIKSISYNCCEYW
jgi:hypothetical protein